MRPAIDPLPLEESDARAARSHRVPLVWRIVRPIVEAIARGFYLRLGVYVGLGGVRPVRSGLFEHCRGNISSREIMRWDQWHEHLSSGDQLSFGGGRSRENATEWSGVGSQYGARRVEIDALTQLCVCEVIENFRCDAAEIECLDSSSETLEEIPSIDDLAVRFCPEYVREMTMENLQVQLAHETSDWPFDGADAVIDRFAWDGRLCWQNGDGSHHFAAARYIASALTVALPMHGRLNVYQLDAGAVTALETAYRIFLLDERSRRGGDFRAALKRFRATYLTADLPRPHEGLTAVFLPRASLRSRLAAKTMQATGQFDLGQYLRLACKQQSKIESIGSQTWNGRR